MDVIVNESKIEGLGVFAARDFKIGEAVLIWHPKIISDSELAKLTEQEKDYVVVGESNLMMGIPERYVNHSCEPNTKAEDNKDVAIKNIDKGDEITSDYSGLTAVSFQCHCGSKNCRGYIS